MFVVVQHEVSRHEEFLERAMKVPEQHHELYLTQFVPSKDRQVAVSLWVAPSVDSVRKVLEDDLGDASVQEYHEVDEKLATDLGQARTAGGGRSAT